MHRTHMGVDQEYHNLIKQSTRCALADGWGGSMISTDLQDIMFGCPTPIAGEINLGVLKEDHVNVIMHGHEPLLPEMLYVAAQDPELITVRPEQGRQGHPAGRHVLLGQRGPDAPRRAGGRQLPAPGAGGDHRRGGRHGGGRAVRDAGPGKASPSATTPRSITTDDRAKMPLATAHPLRRASRPGRGQADHPGGHRQLPQPQGPGADPLDQLPHRGGLQLRDHPVPAGRLHPRLLLHPERQHHQRPDPGRRRRGGLQQLPHHPGQLASRDDQGAAEERRHRPDHRLRRHGRGQIRPADPGSGRQVLRRRAWPRSARPWASRRSCTWGPAWTTPAS